MTYNRPDSDIYITAEKLAKLFEKKFSKVKSVKKLGKREDSSETREITRSDRLKFSQLINQLSSEQLGTLVEMIQKECPEALNEEDDEELEIEINNIDAGTLLNLNSYAQKCSETQNNQTPKTKKMKTGA
jgi:hypothetical protein